MALAAGNEDVARDAGIYAVYFALPALLAWLVLRLRDRMPSWLPELLGVVMLPWAILMTITAASAGAVIPACLLSIGVVLAVAWQLTARARRPRGAGSR